jgi:hypothetical protein
LTLPALSWLGMVWFGFALFGMILLFMTWLGACEGISNAQWNALQLQGSLVRNTPQLQRSVVCNGMHRNCNGFHNT